MGGVRSFLRYAGDNIIYFAISHYRQWPIERHEFIVYSYRHNTIAVRIGLRLCRHFLGINAGENRHDKMLDDDY